MLHVKDDIDTDICPEDWVKKLRTLRRIELRQVFRDCPAPNLTMIRGEYKSELLCQGGAAAQRVTESIFGLEGPWIGKAFRPVNSSSGVGYNMFLKNDRIVAKLPMDTKIEPSTFESGQSMVIRYNLRNFGLIRWLIGELRQVAPGVLIGMGLYGPKWTRDGRSQRKIPFMLVGPQDELQFDTERIQNGGLIVSGRVNMALANRALTAIEKVVSHSPLSRPLDIQR